MDENIKKIEEKVKKSELTASTRFDMERISAAGEHFLPMTWSEERDDWNLSYDASRLIPFSEVRKEDYVTILNLLVLAAQLEGDAQTFRFSLEPENLFYHPCGRVLVKSRDIREKEEISFLKEYRALTGWALTGKYEFRDYLEGGEDLYGKQDVTARLPEFEDADTLAEYLEETLSEYRAKTKKEMISVKRMQFRILKIAAVALTIWAAAVSVYGGIQYFQTIPYLQAVNRADNAYIGKDYTELIRSLREIPIDQLDQHQKYTLALAYLQAENLTEEQRKNAGKHVLLNSDPRYLEYWIQIGRLEAEDAQETAMALMDDELLLYAYLLDQEITQSSDELSGEEKQEKLKTLQSRIKEITDKYGLEEEPEASEK